MFPEALGGKPDQESASPTAVCGSCEGRGPPGTPRHTSRLWETVLTGRRGGSRGPRRGRHDRASPCLVQTVEAPPTATGQPASNRRWRTQHTHAPSPHEHVHTHTRTCTHTHAHARTRTHTRGQSHPHMRTHIQHTQVLRGTRAHEKRHLGVKRIWAQSSEESHR